MNCSRKYYLLRFVYVLAVSFTKTSFIPYLEWRGLSRYELHLVYAIFNIGVMLFEVPVSAIGEWIGPKKSFLFGCLCKCVAAVLFFAGREIYHFYAAEIVSALAVAFISGSLNAWVMDRLNERSAEAPSSVFIIGNRIGKVALALGGAGGAYMAYWHLGYPWLMVGISFLITFYLANLLMTGHDYRPSWKKDKVYPRWTNIARGYRIAMHNKILLVLIFNGFLVSFAQASPKMYWLPYLKRYFSKDMLFLGNMWLCLATIQFLGTFGMLQMQKLAGSLLRLKLIFSTFSVSVFFGLILLKNNVWGFIIVYLLLEWAKPYHRALNLTLIHEETSHAGRITFLSLQSLLSKMGATLGLIVIGWIGEYYGIVMGWSTAIFLYMLVIPCYFCLAWEEWQKKIPLSLAVEQK